MRTLSVESLQVAWRGQTCVQDLSFQVQSGELLALIGSQGPGPGRPGGLALAGA